jgi:hypothetical protein
MSFVMPKLSRVLLVSIFTGLACVYGLIAFSNNPVLISIALGAIVGLMLTLIPRTIISVLIILALATPAFLDLIGHGASKLLWGASVLGIVLWAPGLFYLFSNLLSKNKQVSKLTLLVVLFLVYAVLATCLHFHTMGQLIEGAKRYFQVTGVIVALACIPFAAKDFQRWKTYLIVIALMQLPFALFERLVLVPKRLVVNLGEATDVVAGTLGASLTGGSPNSVMLFLILVALAFVIAKKKENLLSNSKALLLGLVLVTPLLLGETKIAVLLLPVMTFVLFKKEIIAQPLKYFPFMVLTLVASIALGYFYLTYILNTTLEHALYDLNRYNFQNIGYGSLFLNRTTVMEFWWKAHHWYDPITMMFGHGLGASYGSGAEAGHISRMYPNYGIGLTTVASLLWDLGIVGLIFYVSQYIMLWIYTSRIIKTSKSLIYKSDALAIQVAIAFNLIYIFNSDTQVNLIVHELLNAMMFGYGIYMYQQTSRLD